MFNEGKCPREAVNYRGVFIIKTHCHYFVLTQYGCMTAAPPDNTDSYVLLHYFV